MSLDLPMCLIKTQLLCTDIVNLVHKYWHSSICDVKANQRAIAERGWGAFNRNLLLHPIIRASMTETMINNEKEM